ncbi:MAG: hypothetical protein ACYCYP_06570 [Leptospirales bacterium]
MDAVFDQIKTVRGVPQFMRRGIAACAPEWKLLCATYNLLKLVRVGINKANQGAVPCLVPVTCQIRLSLHL